MNAGFPLLPRLIAATTFTVLAGLSSASSNALQRTYEAEACYAQGSTIVEDESASGGQYVELGEGGMLIAEIESEYEGGALVVKLRSPDVDRIVDITIDGVPIGSHLCRATIDGEWETISIPHPLILLGLHVLRIVLSPDSAPGLSVDCMTTCAEASGTPCSGCTAAPLAPAITDLDIVSVLLPPMPGLAGPIAQGAKKVLKGTTATILNISPTTTNGECELKPKDADKPCGERVCVEKKGCSVSVKIKFRANNYMRPPFYDNYEDVTLPDGSTHSYRRNAMPFELTANATGKCGNGQNVVVTFERGTVTQALSCNVCQ